MWQRRRAGCGQQEKTGRSFSVFLLPSGLWFDIHSCKYFVNIDDKYTFCQKYLGQFNPTRPSDDNYNEDDDTEDNDNKDKYNADNNNALIFEGGC